MPGGQRPRLAARPRARPAARRRARARRARRARASVGCGARAASLVAVVQHAEQAPHLGQRLAAGALDRAAASTAPLGVAVEDPPRAAGLDDHHADRVGDHVVHLARDPPALVGRRARASASCASCAARPPRAAPRSAACACARAAGEPGDQREGGGEDEVARTPVGQRERRRRHAATASTTAPSERGAARRKARPSRR